jgi:hypothetical protein
MTFHAMELNLGVSGLISGLGQAYRKVNSQQKGSANEKRSGHFFTV